MVSDGHSLVSIHTEFLGPQQISKLYVGRLEKVLSTAMAEKRMTVAQSSLPHQFYDLQYSSLDIDEALRLWAERTVPHPEDQIAEIRTEFNIGARMSVES